MDARKEELLKRLSDDVFEMEEEDVVDAARAYLEAGYPALDGIMEGLVDGMDRAGVLYEEEEYFVTDLLLCSDAMYAGLEILKPHLPENAEKNKIKGVIGVVEGDTHDIGKNLVKIMMETAGFEMIDLGRDVPAERVVKTAQEQGIRLVGLSALMTTTLASMEQTIRLLRETGVACRVFVGGAVLILIGVKTLREHLGVIAL